MRTEPVHALRTTSAVVWVGSREGEDGGMGEDDATLRSVSVERTSTGSYVARNPRGGEIRVDSTGSADFTPVELLLVAIGACSAVDVDAATSRRAEPTTFRVDVEGHKVVDASGGNVMRDIVVTFDVAFPEGEAGDKARLVLPRAARVSHDKECTVSRTVEAGVPVRIDVGRARP